VLPTTEDVREGRTLAELQGMTEELGGAIAELAAGEAACGNLDAARVLLEGLLVTNPRDALGWALLAQVERRRGEAATALLCAEAARSLDPDDPQVRLARAEVLLALAEGDGEARHELEALRVEGSDVGRRAASLLHALGA
jgi:cytochrome c-type biogenesis protein CcmH/NrfG